MIDVEQSREGNSPFQEQCNTARFFTGGGRGAVLDDMQVALDAKVDIVTLIGEEGSGKTMLCKMLQEQLGNAYQILYLPEIVGSFEAIVRISAQKCGVEYPEETNRADARRIFIDIVEGLRAKDQSLLIISDEAENMYLATLERLRKILDDTRANGGGLQLLFAGRKSFRTSLEQLALCDFDQVAEKQFFLSTLDDNETWEYLNFCVQDLRGESVQEIFSKEAAAKIASMGRGNLRLINIFAEESLQSSNADTSFMVLLDHVRDDERKKIVFPEKKKIVEKLPFSPKIAIAGAVVCFLFLLVLFFNRKEEEIDFIEPESRHEDVVIVEEQDAPVDAPEALQSSATQQEVASAEEVFVEPVAPEKVVEEQPAEEIAEPAAPTGEVEKPAISTDSGTEIEISPLPVMISPVEIVEEKKKMQEIEKPASLESVTITEIVADKKKRLVSQEEKPTIKAVAVPKKRVYPVQTHKGTASSSVDPELKSLVLAGDRWLAGKENTSFSIQLMALQSEHAEENLKRILAKPEYQKILPKLAMLKRPSNPPVIMVFYGLYPNMASARNARNTMPIFLRDRHPYPVSVRGAVEKVRVE